MRKFKIILLSLVVLLTAGIFVLVLTRTVFYYPDFSFSSSLNYYSIHGGEHPAKLLIPSLGIQAKVQDVGITIKGNMGVPNNYVDVGWYKYGVMPGQIGSAVVAGHVDNGLSMPGVFKHLSDLKKGDDVYVLTDLGSQLHFVVTDIQTYYYTDSTDEIFNQKDKARLRLITCTGNWLPFAKTDDHRLVVTAELQS